MVTITLTPELERVITEKSQRAGTTPELIVLDALGQEFLTAAPSTPVDGTLEDFLGDSIGCLDSGEFVPGGARMSENIRVAFESRPPETARPGRFSRHSGVLNPEQADAMLKLIEEDCERVEPT